MKKMKIKAAYLIVGLLAGFTYVVACGGGSSAVASAVNAIDVVYDNVTSALSATNVQAAIDEVVVRVKTLEAGGVAADSVVGAWTGNTYASGWDGTAYNITLNQDGTYTCELVGQVLTYCTSPTSWTLHGNALNLKYDNGGTAGYVLMLVNGVSDNSMTLTYVASNMLIVLTK